MLNLLQAFHKREWEQPKAWIRLGEGVVSTAVRPGEELGNATTISQNEWKVLRAIFANGAFVIFIRDFNR